MIESQLSRSGGTNLFVEFWSLDHDFSDRNSRDRPDIYTVIRFTASLIVDTTNATVKHYTLSKAFI